MNEDKVKVKKPRVQKENKIDIIEAKAKIESAKKIRMTPQQMEYAYYYTLKDSVTYGNATLSYAVAYGYDLPTRQDGTIDTSSNDYRVCQAASSRLSGSPEMIKTIEKILVERLNDTSVDARLSSIIHTGKDTDSIQGIKIYNDLKGRVIKNMNLNVIARPLESVSDEELEKIANGEN